MTVAPDAASGHTGAMTGDLDTGSLAEYEEDRDWTTFNIGGPICASVCTVLKRP